MGFLSDFFEKGKDILQGAKEITGDLMQTVKDKTIETLDKINDVVSIPIYKDFKKARDMNEETQDRYDEMKKEIEKTRIKVQKLLEEYGRVKLQIYDTSIREFVKIFSRIKGVELTDIKSNDKLSNKVVASINLAATDFKVIDGVKTLIASGGAGAVSGAVAFGVVGALASASTGTAISALSGAAATNATLAWLGGGSLVAGGGGVALGTAVLGGLIAIPALIAGGFVLNAKAKEALEDAKANKAQVKKFVAEAETAIEAMEVISERCSQMKSNLLTLNSKLEQMNAGVQNIVDEQIKKNIFKRFWSATKPKLQRILQKLSIPIPNWLTKPTLVAYKKFSNEQKRYIWVATSLAQTTKNMMDTELFSNDGAVTDESAKQLTLAREFVKQLSY